MNNKNNNISVNSLAERDCTGCSMCGAVCPKNAITMQLTVEGFYEPAIENYLCVDCGMCKKACYKFDEKVEIDNKKHYICYSAINKNSYELKTATSGGVSNELMKVCIKQGYKVVGVAYDYEKERAVTRIATKIDELEQFKGSKYFQSHTIDAFKEIVADKTDQRYAVFGTPCQIYAMSKFTDFKRNRDRFILVDLFCHGCPSMNLWRKYLEHSKNKYDVSRFDKIEFRSKVHGWHEFGFKFSVNEAEFKNPKINDEFYELFFDMNTHNKACYECKMRSSLEFTDIRMGDFWGPQYDTNMKGVSAVVVCTERGKKLFEEVKEYFNINLHNFEETIKAQSYKKEHSYSKETRNNILKQLGTEEKLEVIIEQYRAKYPLNKKVKKLTKNTFKLLPKSIYFNIKKILHSI